MKQLLISILETFCPNNVFLQGTLSQDEEYPSKLITFWTNYTADNSHYDNDVTSIDWNVSVMFYSTDPQEVNTIPAQISAALKQNGFIPQGRGNDLPSDKGSHTGWAMDFIYTEYL